MLLEVTIEKYIVYIMHLCIMYNKHFYYARIDIQYFIVFYISIFLSQ